MTVAAAVQKNKCIVIGADTQTNFGDNGMPNDNYGVSKILTINGSYIAGSGWGLYDNILNDLLQSKKNKNLKLSDEKTIFKFFNAFYFTLKEEYSYVNSQCNSDNTPFADLDSRFLITNKNGIFLVSAKISVHKFEKYYAIGSGCDYALGAVHALYDSDLSATEICKKAIQTGIALNIHCGGQPDLREIKL
jgi:ATP-dependent protease HslVU (ClpYQ) peptidase subunit